MALITVERRPASGGQPRPDDVADMPVDLLMDLEGMASLLRARPSTLDGFLLAAGINQIAEDSLHRDVLALARVQRLLRESRSPLGRPVAFAVGILRQALLSARSWHPTERRLQAWQARVSALVAHFSQAVFDPPEDLSHRAAAVDPVVRPVPGFPRALRREVLRLPSCFRSFDQSPRDCRRLVEMFRTRWPDLDRPILVVGIRTSGSYLAPLVSASLTAEGYAKVTTMTMRPGEPWLSTDRRQLARVRQANGLVLLTDDPPASGGSLAAAASALIEQGSSEQAIVVLIPLFGPAGSLPEMLRRFQVVSLPWEQWSVQERLEPEAIRRDLNALLVGRRIQVLAESSPGPLVEVAAIQDVTRSGLPSAPGPSGISGRRHLRALYQVTLITASGEPVSHLVYIKGVGLGFFGQHSLRVARAIPTFVGATYGLRDGLLFRAWIPEAWRIDPRTVRNEPMLARKIANYVEARNQDLPAGQDMSSRLIGRHAVWQRTADILSPCFGRVRPLIRPLLHGATQRLLRVAEPSIVDGSMALEQWFAPPGRPAGEAEVWKVDYDEHAFSNDDLSCYDPVFDLAGIAADAEVHCREVSEAWLASLLRSQYEKSMGTPISDERWLLYQTLHRIGALRRQQRTLAGATAIADRRAAATAIASELRSLARLHQRYFGSRFFSDIHPADGGPLCAIDVDGVLETGWLGFPAITPAGALALRALTCHGYRPVVATGRSVDEVQDRCHAYRLWGGVAEYGAVVYQHQRDCLRVLLRPEEHELLNQLRSRLGSMPGVYLDESYRYAVRAYTVDRDGQRHGLSQDLLDAAVITEWHPVTPILGGLQTDFMVKRIDKGVGLRALAEESGAAAPTHGPPLAFAMGDTASDLPMLAVAEHPFAPANAAAGLGDHSAGRSPVRRARRRYQAGLHEAVASFVGHSPGGCPACRLPPGSVDAGLLLAIFSAQDAGRWGKLMQALALLRQLSR